MRDSRLALRHRHQSVIRLGLAVAAWALAGAFAPSVAAGAEWTGAAALGAAGGVCHAAPDFPANATAAGVGVGVGVGVTGAGPMCAAQVIRPAAVPVTAVVHRFTDRLVTLRTAGGRIVTTPEHPFAKLGVGWTAAGQLVAGDDIVTAAGDHTARILAVETRPVQPTPVYNLTVRGAHAYYVGTDRLLVHNVCGDPGSGAAGPSDGLAFRYHPTSGVRIPADAPAGSYIIGSFAADMNHLERELEYPRSGGRLDYNFPVPAGQRFNLLNVSQDDYSYWMTQRGRFFRNVNGPWIDSAVAKGANIYVASDVTKYLSTTVRETTGEVRTRLTGFGKEIHRLEWKFDYRYDPVTHMMVPPGTPGWENMPLLTARGNLDLNYQPDPDTRP